MTAPQLGIEHQAFQRLMPFSVRNILLLSSVYDYYIFEEDGQLFELLRNEYHGFNLRRIPEIVHVTTGEEALALARGSRRFDLVVTTLHIEDMAATEFARRLREVDHHTPIVLLAYDNRELGELQDRGDVSLFERLFVWQGDFRIFLGIIKDIEDRYNVENDTRIAGVQVIILIEDNVRYYSAFLPIIYAEVLHHTQRLIREGRNLTHRYLRVRARPKILLCTTYEEALDYYTRYEDNVLGIISDVAFPRNGELDAHAGLSFASEVRGRHPDIPIILQSNAVGERGAARNIGAAFLLKDSPVLLQDLRRFMVESFAFGDFVFHTQDGTEVGRASDLRSLERELARVPEDSIRFHAERNHFSNWLKARTEFRLAHRLRPRKLSDYPNVQALREDVIKSLREYRKARERGIVTDFVAAEFDAADGFARLGGGSLGGKARGLAFVNRVLASAKLERAFTSVQVSVPAAIALGTDVFDAFLDDNDLRTFALGDVDDHALTQRFLEAERFPEEIITSLKGLLEVMTCPLAVRSSSLLEDSQYHPFAGVYGTYMLPNNEPTDEERLRELLHAIKRVYASTFYRAAKDYMRATSYRLEEEKMAVLIQRLVGAVHGDRFYPDISGVARSYNFYPAGPQTPADGIANVALGLGRLVVGGEGGLRLCPRYPDHLPQFPTVKDTIKNSQQSFYALQLSARHLAIDDTEDSLVQSFRIDDAYTDGTLRWVGSTYVADNEAIYDGLSRRGRRIVTFAPILKQKLFPLPEIVAELLAIGTRTMGTSVEIEFAARLSPVE
ncbi:MAG: PEP/pyruvate-binding domain-containing protein, partial [Myxococcota bacterium]